MEEHLLIKRCLQGHSQQMIAEGHPKAIELWNSWKPTMMTNFPDVTDQELENLLKYVEWQFQQN